MSFEKQKHSMLQFSKIMKNFDKYIGDTALIEVKDLFHSYGEGNLKREILHKISVNFYKKEIMIIIGPSGAGKTTFLTLISALRKVQTGSILVDGIELNGATEDDKLKVRRKIGFVFQAHNLFESLTACQNVQMSLVYQPGETAASSRQKAIEELTKVGLGDFVNKKPNQLSGGQKQRIAIARALVHKPMIIMADEPTAALDKKTGREIVNLLYKLAKESKCSVIIVTHDNRILDIADRIIKFEDGQLEETDFIIKKMISDIFKVMEMLPKYFHDENTDNSDLTAYHEKVIVILENLDSYILNDIYKGVNEKLKSAVLLIEEMKDCLSFFEENLYRLLQISDKSLDFFLKIDLNLKKHLEFYFNSLLIFFKEKENNTSKISLESIIIEIEKTKGIIEEGLLKKCYKEEAEVLDTYNLYSQLVYFLIQFIKTLIKWQEVPSLENSIAIHE